MVCVVDVLHVNWRRCIDVTFCGIRRLRSFIGIKYLENRTFGVLDVVGCDVEVRVLVEMAFLGGWECV